MTTTRKPRTTLPKALAEAKTLADAARALDVAPKSFRRYVRSTLGINVNKGGVFDTAAKKKALAHYTKGASA